MRYRMDENAANGTVLGTVSADDPDAGATLSFAIIGGNPNNAFAIDASGQLRIQST